jgi:hypothetical protein
LDISPVKSRLRHLAVPRCRLDPRPALSTIVSSKKVRVSADPAMWAGATLVHLAGRVAGPVAGEDGGAHRELRRVLGARRRAETDARSIV